MALTFIPRGSYLIEVEFKARVDDLSRVRERAKALGATYVCVRREHDIYLNHPCRDFAESDEALRVRQANGESFLTYKGKKLSPLTKTREEISIKVDSFDSAKQLLEALGFAEVACVVKEREVWKLGEATIYLDRVEKLGSFVEVEMETEGERLEDVEKRLLKLVEAIGLRKDMSIRESYLELLLAKTKG